MLWSIDWPNNIVEFTSLIVPKPKTNVAADE